MTEAERADVGAFWNFGTGCWCTDLFGLAVLFGGQADDAELQRQYIIAQEAARHIRQLQPRVIAALCAKGKGP